MGKAGTRDKPWPSIQAYILLYSQAAIAPMRQDSSIRSYIKHISTLDPETKDGITYIIHTEVVQCSSDFNLLLSVEEGIGKLFTFSQGTLNYLETRYVAKKVTNRLVRIF